MGRYRNIPMEDGSIVRENKISNGSETPYYPQDINKAVCQRLFGKDYVPPYRDE